MKIIETKRLLLKEWQRRDAARLYEYAKNPAVGWDAGWQPHESPAMSRRIITKVFIPRGTRKIVRKKAYLMYDGSFRDLLCYSLTKEEWESHRWRQETGGYIKEYRAIW